jgi:hypothetical protein
MLLRYLLAFLLSYKSSKNQDKSRKEKNIFIIWLNLPNQCYLIYPTQLGDILL